MRAQASRAAGVCGLVTRGQWTGRENVERRRDLEVEAVLFASASGLSVAVSTGLDIVRLIGSLDQDSKDVRVGLNIHRGWTSWAVWL